ncbi:hypothetical protein SCLCIDRAFT_203710 [Scleroderma citrinum Foug A]|uniref:Uncharacterized protein n=1 Tax=Scleroderma citrinum Foug A TaxID=1036808 RepID=A0A0C2ZW99_9AGAM|nr:hypothetical protein SCLCIDRAFT_203710 [Scleroderma citrinum Foug A]
MVKVPEEGTKEKHSIYDISDDGGKTKCKTKTCWNEDVIPQNIRVTRRRRPSSPKCSMFTPFSTLVYLYTVFIDSAGYRSPMAKSTLPTDSQISPTS